MPHALKLGRLKFRVGSAPGAAPVEVTASPVIVLVGPNDSGKSLTLREIEQWCKGNAAIGKRLDQIEITFPTNSDDAVELVKVFETPPPPNQVTAAENIWVGLPQFRADQQPIRMQVSLVALRAFVTNKQIDPLRTILSQLYTIRLDGRTRFALTDEKPTGDILGPPENHLAALFADDHARERVRQLTEEAFELSFVIDPTHLQFFRVRMSDRKPNSTTEEQAIDHTARQFHAAARGTSDLSDGVLSFTGLVSAVLSLPHRILLVDEPEAFLHPPLARRLGRNLTSIAVERDASLVTATHSADFLMGCIEATADISIVRVMYSKGIATAHTIAPAALRILIRDPLLRSTQALRGLFHKAAVVTEAEADRAFYEEINARLVATGRGIPDSLFVIADNWMTVPRIAEPLRRMGVPAAAILDLDALAEASHWPRFYSMIALDAASAAKIEAQRVKCEGHMKALPLTADKRKQYKVNGLSAFGGVQRSEIETLIDQLATYGIFVVPVGELERWLGTLGVPADPKKTWLSRIFTAMGDDPAAAAFVAPGNNDVWAFLEQIDVWVQNPARAGMQ
jgi:ABC-type cobalamin/Fe3+-siderophores transport system ATPase subunit